MLSMTDTLLQKYGGPVPRYTSYPTAPHMSDAVNGETACRWLSNLTDGEPISLYVHVPFCDSLCWFCGCHTKVTNRAEDPAGPVARYIGLVERELKLLADQAGAGKSGPPPLSRMHWGGGSPSLLTPALIERLSEAVFSLFPKTDDHVFSVEIDPRGVGEDRMDAFAAAGVGRISIGVQDFDPAVQKAINREQSFADTERVAKGMRARGVQSLNIDLMYGLPHQGLETIERTVEQALALDPDRIALFGYAHVPWMKKHQRLIDETALPNSASRSAMAHHADRLLRKAGYEAIGIDHYARPGDRLVTLRDAGTLSRNFQGYTDDPAKALLAAGVSAISAYPNGLAQNEPDLAAYREQVVAGKLPIVKGCALSDEDKLRAAVIERIMCDFSADLPLIASEVGVPLENLAEDIARLRPLLDDGLATVSAMGRLHVTGAGLPYVRQIAACFDQYLPRGTARHSLAV